MEPTLPLGSAVVIQPVAPEAIAVGDVVSVKAGAETAIFTHRVVRLLALEGEPYIETKGDNNPAPDGATVPASTVIGRVAWSIPLMGYVIALLSVPSGVAFVLGLGALLLLGALLADSVEADRRTSRRPMPAPTTLAAAPPAISAAESSMDFGAGAVAALVRGRRRDRVELGTEPAMAAPRPGQPRRRRSPKPTA